MDWFDSMDDESLKFWIWQYAGRQAGFYPNIRRQRLAAERVASARVLALKQQVPCMLARRAAAANSFS